ncbi:hypothetical protein L484_022090 [Morus notabilis]|uniref:VQ domain-containing protein n=2 Tax=Morus notabilis TaxID=981085 RepID=W9QN94_9ROSA|nr:hypothetical protein L484_022090 [Morus notabilis]
MDSGNTSGSMQSSSGGDEEYDSRAAESISALLSNNLPQNDVVHHHHHHQHQSSMFDPLSNFFDPVSSSSSSRSLNPNPFLNLDMVWPKPVRSDPNPNSSELVSLIPSSSQPNFFSSNNSIQLGQTAVAGASNFPAIQIAPEIQTRSQIHRLPSSSSADRNDAVNITPNGGAAPRNPKKRSRASRRAPTTVLTTDTSNFRAMVQEFTGIPAPPFTSSPFPRTRLDLFGSGSGIRSAPLDPHHHHPSTGTSSYNLLRPFAQKIQQTTPFVNTSASSSSSPSTTTSNSLLNIQTNPVLSFHSLLQNAPPKFAKMGSTSASADQFGLSHGHHVNVNPQLGGIPNPPTTMATTTATNWGITTDHGMGSNDNNNGNNGNNSNVDEGLLLRSINGGYTANTTAASAAAVSNGHKVNYSASSSTDFHGSKTEINVAARSEGMVESWICSSD